MSENKLSIKQISKITGVKPQNIYEIKNFISWFDIGSNYNNAIKKNKKKKRLTTEDEIKEIVKLKFESKELSNKEISDKLNISSSRVLETLKFTYIILTKKYKKCEICDEIFFPKSNSGKYCDDCKNYKNIGIKIISKNNVLVKKYFSLNACVKYIMKNNLSTGKYKYIKSQIISNLNTNIFKFGYRYESFKINHNKSDFINFVLMNFKTEENIKFSRTQINK